MQQISQTNWVSTLSASATGTFKLRVRLPARDSMRVSIGCLTSWPKSREQSRFLEVSLIFSGALIRVVGWSCGMAYFRCPTKDGSLIYLGHKLSSCLATN
mmetsp:Transcript_54123/g.113148  ORF Transcript_54123/g.113148 Transcript_54123/m.113148 type:complete len:100 (+) Transcript_54123:532-831(+)